MNRPETRYRVNLQVFLSWQDRQGSVHRAPARCLNLAASGAHVETVDPLMPQTGVLVHSKALGRMGHATVRYCFRLGMRYKVGLQFSSALALSDCLRRQTVERANSTEPDVRSLGI